jgi:hypothetical protein
MVMAARIPTQGTPSTPEFSPNLFVIREMTNVACPQKSLEKLI